MSDFCDHERPIKTEPESSADKTAQNRDGRPDPAVAPQEYPENNLSEVRHVIGVISGKGGVGKSMVTTLVARELSRRGHKVGILDADLTGPSIPHMVGLAGKRASALGNLLLPAISESGIKVMSANLILNNESDPVLWRGPVLAGAIRQFWSETSWGPLDYLLVDMPPGTGDVALTVFQSLPIEGIIIVTSPQDLVRMIVGKAAKMAELMHIPVLGLVENMSYLPCPHCGEHIELFGPSHAQQTADDYGISLLDQLPVNSALAAAADSGELDSYDTAGLVDKSCELLEALPTKDA